MTREEAIRHGKEQLEVFGEGCEHYEFIKMAIKALEQEPKYTDNEFFNFDAPIVKKSLNDAISREKEPCENCIFEEGSRYCVEHCPHEARVESYEDKQMNNISKNIARMFADFVNSFEYDAYEIAMVCSQVLNENNVKFNCAKHPIGIDIFTDTEMESEE